MIPLWELEMLEELVTVTLITLRKRRKQRCLHVWVQIASYSFHSLLVEVQRNALIELGSYHMRVAYAQ